MMFLKKQNNPEVSRANPLRARPGDAERQGTIQFSLQMSTEVPASILINTLIQPKDATMRIVSFRKAPLPLNGASPGDRV
jgi:hypothetical protein